MELTMPVSFIAMDEEEMTYVDGGAQHYLTGREFDKDYCKSVAKNYMAETGLSQSRIAKEIFAHAVLFAFGITGKVVSIMNGISGFQNELDYIINHSNPVDIGGDSWARVAIYNVIWYHPATWFM